MFQHWSNSKTEQINPNSCGNKYWTTRYTRYDRRRPTGRPGRRTDIFPCRSEKFFNFGKKGERQAKIWPPTPFTDFFRVLNRVCEVKEQQKERVVLLLGPEMKPPRPDFSPFHIYQKQQITFLFCSSLLNSLHKLVLNGRENVRGHLTPSILRGNGTIK